MTSTWKIESTLIDALEVLSDESIVVVSGSTSLSRYDRKNGDKLYIRNIVNWAGGLAEVILNGRQSLAISFKEVRNKQGHFRYLNVIYIEFAFNISNSFIGIKSN